MEPRITVIRGSIAPREAQRYRDEAVDEIVAAMTEHEGRPVGELLHASLTRRRRFDRGNAEQSALSDGFARVGLDDLWALLDRRAPSTRDLRFALAEAVAAQRRRARQRCAA